MTKPVPIRQGWAARPGTDDAEKCPVRDVLDRLGETWSVLAMLTLAEGGPHRFNELRRAIGDVSQRMLAVTLRNLERDGMVQRTVFPSSPPRVEYRLTPLGRSLADPIDALTDWATANHRSIKAARKAFDARSRDAAA